MKKIKKVYKSSAYTVTPFTEGLLEYPSKFSPQHDQPPDPMVRRNGHWVAVSECTNCSWALDLLGLGLGWHGKELTNQLWGNRDGKRWPESGNMWKLWRKVIEGMNLCKRKMVEKGRHHFRVGQRIAETVPKLASSLPLVRLIVHNPRVGLINPFGIYESIPNHYITTTGNYGKQILRK